MFKKKREKNTAKPLKIGSIGGPEKSVLNHLTPHNNPENGRIQFNRGGSVTDIGLVNWEVGVA